jgi:outer membrane receptor protein involved in Fe transport
MVAYRDRKSVPGRLALLQGAATVAFILAASSARADENKGSEVAEVLVTAQKSTERLQEVPVSVSAVSTEQLTAANATKLLDIANLVPGLSIVSQTGAPGSSTINIRGISTADAAAITVATIVDDVPVNSSTANAYAGYAGLDILPFNVQGVEILKGPQGTLYGASSLGGIVKYVTPTPSLSEPSLVLGGDVSGVSHGDQVGNGLRIAASAPVVNGVLAVGASFAHVFTPGYIENVATGQSNYNHGTQDGARFSLVWEPNEGLRVKATAILQASDFHGVSTIPLNDAGTAPTQGYYKAFYPTPNRTRQHTQVYIGNVSYDFGWATLTSVTGYSNLRSSFNLDLSTAAYAIRLGIYGNDSYTVITRKFTEEVRLQSSDEGRLTWLAGFYYTNEDSNYYETATPLNFNGTVASQFVPFYYNAIDSTYEEVAGFANVGFKITEAWDISAGIRYATNDQEASVVAFGVLQGGVLDVPNVKSSDSKVTYSFDTRYRVSPDVMVYGRIATGYRPGGANLLRNVPPTFEPDTTTNYEVGLKSEWLDRRLLLNVSAFYIDWSKIHVLERVGNLDTFTGNAGKAVSRGIELTTQYELVDDFWIGLNGAFTDAELKSDYSRLAAVKGDPLPNMPRWTGSLYANYARDLENGYRLKVSGNWLYVGDRMSDFRGARPAGIRLKEYNTLNLQAGIDNGSWSFGLFMKNALDRKAYVTRRNFGATILQPRTFGVSVDRTF